MRFFETVVEGGLQGIAGRSKKRGFEGLKGGSGGRFSAWDNGSLSQGFERVRGLFDEREQQGGAEGARAIQL